ncbi:MAG: caspase family protein [Deltaproteobacteria bacterium]|nr:caspase family protein [Deltaproteobacteria bacterium]
MKFFKIIFGFVICIILSSCANITTTATPHIRVTGGDTAMELTESPLVSVRAALSPDGKYLLTGGLKENGFRLWDLSRGAQIRQFRTEGTGTVVPWTQHTYGTVQVGMPVAFSPDGKYCVSGGRELKFWDVSSGKEIRTISDMNSRLLSVSSDGMKVLSVGTKPRESPMAFYDITTGNLIREFTQTGDVLSVALSPDGRYALTGQGGAPSAPGGPRSRSGGDTGGRNLMVLRNVSTGRAARNFSWDKERSVVKPEVGSVAFSPDGRYALAGDNGGYLELWDILSGTELMRFKGHEATASHYHPGVGYVSFSRDGRYIISGGVADGLIKLWDASSGSQIKTLVYQREGNVGISYAAISCDGKCVVAMGADASVRIFDFATGAEIAMMAGFEGGEWLVITSEGYYNASEKGAQYLKVKFGGKDYSVDQFYDVFYRPDIVAAKLGGQDISGLISISMKDASVNPPPLVNITTPQAANTQKVKVCYTVKSTGGGIGEVRLFHNGKLIQSDGYYREIVRSTVDKTQLAALNSKAIYADMRSVSVIGTADNIPISTKLKGDVLEDCKEIDAVPGDNEVSIAAFNSSNTVQSYMKTVSFNSQLKQEESHLYILAVGIDQYKDANVNLKYAVKDAKDLEEKLKVQSATLYKPENIHYLLLTEREATKTNIVNKVNELSNTIKPEDSFILFVAGHGVLLQNQYYMLTHDYDGMVNDNSMISSNEIVEMSKKIKSLSQLFIFDTCHAGGVDYIVSGLYDARMSVLAKKMGLHIYASANDKQAAMDGYKGNGLFTHVLLDGLNNNKEADKNKDGKVTVVGLGEYSKKMTANISKEIGHSQTPLIINFGKDSPIYKLQ